jgi:hypothetical protein
MTFAVQGGKIISDWEFDALVGKNAVGHGVLEFRFSVGSRDYEGLTAAWYNPRVRVSTGPSRREAEILGEARSHDHVSRRSTHQSATGVKLQMNVTLRQILEIEERRSDSINFFFEIAADAVIYDVSDKVVQDFPLHQGVSTRGQYRMREQEWLDVLKDLGYSDYLIQKIPLPDEEERPSVAGAIKYLQDAKTAFDERRYGDAVGKCRKAIDKLNEAYEQPESLGELLREVSEDKETHSKRERELLLRGAARHYTHPPHHIEIDDYTRDEASLIMGVTTSLLSNAVVGDFQ